MPDEPRPLLGDLKDEVATAARELGEVARLRVELARLEAQEAIAAGKRLAVVAAMAAVMVLSALPVLVVCAGHLLAAWPGGMPAPGWMLVLAVLLLGVGGAWGWLAWRRFRRELRAFEQSLEELREDLVWLGDWAGDRAAGRAPAE